MGGTRSLPPSKELSPEGGGLRESHHSMGLLPVSLGAAGRATRRTSPGNGKPDTSSSTAASCHLSLPASCGNGRVHISSRKATVGRVML